MDLIRDPSATSEKPAPSGDGTAGWAKTDGTTVIPPQWGNMIMAEMKAIVEAAGLTLDPTNEAQLLVSLSGALAAVGASPSETIEDATTPFNKAIVAAANCGVSVGLSAIVASEDSTTDASKTFVAACDNGHSSVGLGAVIGCRDAWGHGNVLLSSINAELVTFKAIGWGYDLGETITPNGTNQNLTGMIRPDTGNVHFGGSLRLGGDVDAGSGGAVLAFNPVGSILELAAGLEVAGDATFDGNLDVGESVDVAGGVQVGGSLQTTDFISTGKGLSVEYGTYVMEEGAGVAFLNTVSGKVTTQEITIGAGSSYTFSLTNTRIGAGSIVIIPSVSPSGSDAGWWSKISVHCYYQTTGMAYMVIRNSDGDGHTAAFSVRFYVVNPVY